MDATATTLSLEDGLRQARPDNVRFHNLDNVRFRNLFYERTVLLGELLGVAPLERIRLLAGAKWNFPMWLIVTGQRSALAQIGLSAELLHALGLAPQLSMPVLSAVATQMLSPLLPSLRELFEQDVKVRVDKTENVETDTSPWPKFTLLSSTLMLGVSCGVNEAFSQKLMDRACAMPRKEHLETRVPLFLGAQQLLSPSQVSGLQVGDVIVMEDGPLRCLDLRIDPPTARQPSSRLAVVNVDDGRIEHLSPGSRHEVQPRWHAHGSAALAVDIVMGRMTLPTQHCRDLALGECVREWDSVAWTEEAELRACGRTLGTARAVTIVGRRGYEVVRLSPGPR